MRQGIHLHGYAAKNPKQEYKREAFEMLSQMLVEIKHEAIRIISHVQLQQEDSTEELERQRREELARQIGQSAETDKAIQASYSASGWTRGFSFFSQTIGK